MFKFQNIPTKYFSNKTYVNYILSRKDYSFYYYDNDELISRCYQIPSYYDYLKDAAQIYEFYENYPDSGIESPEEINITQEDVIEYYYKKNFIKLKYDSQFIFIFHNPLPIPVEIFREKYDERIRDFKSILQRIHFDKIIYIIIGIIWIIWIIYNWKDINDFGDVILFIFVFPVCFIIYWVSMPIFLFAALYFIEIPFIIIHSKIMKNREKKELSTFKKTKVGMLEEKQKEYIKEFNNKVSL